MLSRQIVFPGEYDRGQRRRRPRVPSLVVPIYCVAAQLRGGRTSLPRPRPASYAGVIGRGEPRPRLCPMLFRGVAWRAANHGISRPPASTESAFSDRVAQPLHSLSSRDSCSRDEGDCCSWRPISFQATPEHCCEFCWTTRAARLLTTWLGF